MATIHYTLSTTDNDLRGISALQKSNLPAGLSDEEIRSQGFVTVSHSPEMLRKLQDIEAHVIARMDNKVVGYVLAMTAASRHDIPILIPMFDVFDAMDYRGRKVSDYRYMVVGQVCVHRDCRGQGVFDLLYALYRDTYSTAYDFAITEIAETNLRSIRAHERVGFDIVHRYRDPSGVDWVIVLWDWQAPKKA